MKYSCPYCGRIHEAGYICPNKPVRKYKYNTAAYKFHHTAAWTKKAIEIKRRDSYLCQACLRELEGTVRKYEYETLEVHHIIPIEEEPQRQLDDDNLITLCRTHHEMAERGDIKRETLLMIAKEQNERENE